MGAVVTVAAVVGIALAACTSGGSGRGPSPVRPGVTPSAVTPGGPAETIRFGLLGEPATLDPFGATASEHTWTIARATYPSLFRFDPEGSPQPLLAESIEVGEDRATVRLVGSASWSDGSPLTSRDVVASWKRARATAGPSGFRDIDVARATGPTTVVFTGRVPDWETTLARVAYVLPGGKHGDRTAGPFRIRRRTPGLEVVLEPDPLWFGSAGARSVIRVQFIRTTGTMLGLLEDGRLDAAAVPSMVNLAERAGAAGLQLDSALGWETIRLSFGGELDRAERVGFVRTLDLAAFQETLIREDGRRAASLHPQPRDPSGPYGSLGRGTEPAGELTITSPAGDELLTLLLRGTYAQLDRAGIVAEASPIDPFIFYGEWLQDDPSDVSIRRVGGAPGLRVPRDDPTGMNHFPLFQVATHISFSDGVEGPEANPTLDGPLWNAESWRVARGS